MNEKASLHEFFGYTIESITNFTTTEMRLWLVYSKINVISLYYTLITFYYLNNYEIYNFEKKEKKKKKNTQSIWSVVCTYKKNLIFSRSFGRRIIILFDISYLKGRGRHQEDNHATI